MQRTAAEILCDLKPVSERSVADDETGVFMYFLNSVVERCKRTPLNSFPVYVKYDVSRKCEIYKHVIAVDELIRPLGYTVSTLGGMTLGGDIVSGNLKVGLVRDEEKEKESR